MKTAREIMNEAKSRYRHTFGDPIIIPLLNTVIKDIWKKIPKESLPSTIVCNKSEIYPIPNGIRRRNIKRISYGKPTGRFTTLEPIVVEENLTFGYYVLTENYIIIKEDQISPDVYVLMVYYDKIDPNAITDQNLDDPVDLDEAYEEAAIVGLLEKITAMRKDVKMKNNYAAEYNVQLGDILIDAVDKDPDYPSCKDQLPRRGRYYGGSMDER